jgi:hypothetical protein
MKYLILMLLIGCSAKSNEYQEAAYHGYNLRCTPVVAYGYRGVRGGLHRCENGEVVCYSSNQTFSCVRR